MRCVECSEQNLSIQNLMPIAFASNIEVETYQSYLILKIRIPVVIIINIVSGNLVARNSKKR